MVELTVE